MEEAKYEAKDMLLAAVENARAARTEAGREDDSYIVLDIGPIGQLLEPMGTLTFDEAYDIILEQVETVKDQVDLVLFETMSDLYEVKAGVLAVKEHTDLPVFVTMTFEQNGRTLSGNDPQSAQTYLRVSGSDESIHQPAGLLRRRILRRTSETERTHQKAVKADDGILWYHRPE